MTTSQLPNVVEPSPEEGFRSLDPKAKSLWRTSEVLLEVVVAIAVVVCVVLFVPESVPTWVVAGGFVLYALLSVAEIIFVPVIRWKRWRYQIREHEIHLKYGFIWKTETVVPLRRVQHIEVGQGPLERLFGLSTLTFYTAAEEHEIPALNKSEANLVRDRIARLTRTLDDI